MLHEKNVSFYLEEELQRYMTPEAKNVFLCAWYRYMFNYIPFLSGLTASLMKLKALRVTTQLPVASTIRVKQCYTLLITQ